MHEDFHRFIYGAVLLATIGACAALVIVHSLVAVSRIARVLLIELRKQASVIEDEVREWRKFFRPKK